MASGIKLPFQADKYGRLATVSGEEQLRKIIIIGLTDQDHANPWMEKEDNVGAVFGVNDDEARSHLQQRVIALFDRLERDERAKLAPGSPTFESKPDTGELQIDVRYVNLETTTEEEMRLSFEGQILREV